MGKDTATEQEEVIRFLMSGAAFPGGEIRHVQTHCAHVFLGGDLALKIKRAVRYDYLDQSTADLRRRLLDQELALNRPTAPMVYRDVVPVTRAKSGGLEVDGPGPPVEWALRMNRFPESCEMTEVADSGRMDDRIAEALGSTVQRFHAGCPVRPDSGQALIGEILDELGRVLLPLAAALDGDLAEAFLDRARQKLERLAPVLRQRSDLGHVRRVHGDLHLRNLLLIEGHPVLFDALEFDDRLATCDVLYDLAFLLMDLCHRGLARQANLAMTSYLLAAKGAEDEGLAALPLFLSIRAAIRAMVLLQTGQVAGQTPALAGEARAYLDQAVGHLTQSRPRLVAAGGMSGTGKTVLARDLAPVIGACPGAVHLRTDTERKLRPGQPGYDPAARSAVYEQMFARAKTLLAAGRSVLLDATFLDPAHRAAAESLARQSDVQFTGLWLTAPLAVLFGRVASRRGDASDADADVVRAQARLAQARPASWADIPAGGMPEQTRRAGLAALQPG